MVALCLQLPSLPERVVPVRLGCLCGLACMASRNAGRQCTGTKPSSVKGAPLMATSCWTIRRAVVFHLDLQASRWQRVLLRSLRILLWGAGWLQCCRCRSTMSPVASQQLPQACGRRAASQIQEGSTPGLQVTCAVQQALHRSKVTCCAAGNPPLKSAFSSYEKEQQLEAAAKLHRQCAKLLQLWPTSMQQDEAVLQQQDLHIEQRHRQAVVMRHEFKQLVISGQEVLDLYAAHLRLS